MYEFAFGITILKLLWRFLRILFVRVPSVQEPSASSYRGKWEKGESEREKTAMFAREGCRSARARHTCILEKRGISTGVLRDTWLPSIVYNVIVFYNVRSVPWGRELKRRKTNAERKVLGWPRVVKSSGEREGRVGPRVRHSWRLKSIKSVLTWTNECSPPKCSRDTWSRSRRHGEAWFPTSEATYATRPLMFEVSKLRPGPTLEKIKILGQATFRKSQLK